MSILKANNLQLLDASRNISVSKIAEMNGGFSFRNKIIDGMFDFWYEGTSQTSNGYGSDTMWHNQSAGSTKVHSMQPLVAGVDLPAIEVPSAKCFSRTVVTSVAGASNLVIKKQRIEDVCTLAGKTATLSFYAKADAVKNIAVGIDQIFGAGGSSTEFVGSQLVGLSTSWKRYSVQVNFPTIVGKTIGSNSLVALNFWFDAGSSFASMTNNLGQQSGTFDIACVQLEEGSVSTPFEELPHAITKSLVDRYFRRAYWSASGYSIYQEYIRLSTVPGEEVFNTMRSNPVASNITVIESYNINTAIIESTGSRVLIQQAAAGYAYIQLSAYLDSRL